MHLLVDFDNVLALERQRGPVFLVEKLLRTIEFGVVSKYKRVVVRLYGGWLEERRLSRGAQALIPLLQSEFPRSVAITSSGVSHTVIAAVELAQAMLCDPTTTITHTFRQRSEIGKVRCHSAPHASCANVANCALAVVEGFMNAKLCPEANCGVTPEKILYAAEQKLVDTMLVSDLLYLAGKSSDDICVVSSDDDLWPGIFSSLIFGRRIVHVHTRPGRGALTPYRAPKGSDYIVLQL